MPILYRNFNNLRSAPANLTPTLVLNPEFPMKPSKVKYKLCDGYTIFCAI
jgi:hypothetical protein